MPKNGKLTPKQKRFADEYLIDLNATRAYQAAYPSVKKEAAARANGSKLLAKANVAEYVAERMLKRQQRTEVTQDRVIQELAAIAFARATDYVKIDQNGRVVLSPTDKLSDTQKAAITAIKETQSGIEIKLADKVRALEDLGKHLGILDGNGNGKGVEDRITEYLNKLEEIVNDEH